MKQYKECPLCGKKINEDEELCESCTEYADNLYQVDLIRETEDTLKIDDQETASIGTEKNSKEEQTSHKKKKTSKWIIFLLAGCVLVVILGIWGVFNVSEAQKLGETEDMYWQMCVTENTPTSYSKYVVRFPNGKYEKLAYQKIDEFRIKEYSDWENLSKSTNLDDYIDFMTRYPNTIYMDAARYRIDSLAWQIAIKGGSIESYRTYLDNANLDHYGGIYSENAKYRIDYLSALKPISGKTLDTLQLNIRLFYDALSSLNNDILLKNLDSTLVYYDRSLSSNSLVDSIKEMYKANHIQERSFNTTDSIKAFKDINGDILVDLVVDITTKLNPSDKKNNKQKIEPIEEKDTLQFRFNRLHKITCIQKQAKAKLFEN